MKLTALVHPPHPDEGPSSTPAREYDRVDEFVAALNLIDGITASVVEGTITDAPDDGLILLYNPLPEGLDVPLEFGPRIIHVNADRGSVRKDIEKYQLVAAIVHGEYFDWCPKKDQDSCGLLARQDVAERMGAVMVSHYYMTPHYAEYRHPEHPSLPRFLAHYLLAFERSEGQGR